VSQKSTTPSFGHDFAKYSPIIKILYLFVIRKCTTNILLVISVYFECVVTLHCEMLGLMTENWRSVRCGRKVLSTHAEEKFTAATWRCFNGCRVSVFWRFLRTCSNRKFCGIIMRGDDIHSHWKVIRFRDTRLQLHLHTALVPCLVVHAHSAVYSRLPVQL